MSDELLGQWMFAALLMAAAWTAVLIFGIVWLVWRRFRVRVIHWMILRNLAFCQCYDCGRLYGHEYGFPDLVVPNDVWAKISPTGHEGGLLCPSCMCRRADKAGVSCVAKFRSGPFCDPD